MGVFDTGVFFCLFFCLLPFLSRKSKSRCEVLILNNTKHTKLMENICALHARRWQWFVIVIKKRPSISERIVWYKKVRWYEVVLIVADSLD